MKKVTKAYKEAMSNKIRDIGYVNISLGLINSEAQSTSEFTGKYAYWSNKSLPFENEPNYIEYATLETDYLRADGNMYFLPRQNSVMQLQNSAITTKDTMGEITIVFSKKMSIKGLTLFFGNYYPLKFKVETEEKTIVYENNKPSFVTYDTFFDTTYIKIIPVQMLNGNKRLRLEKIAMGVGLNYSNNDLVLSEFEEFVNGISAETPYQNLNFTILDKNNLYNIDADNSYINFLKTNQKVEISYGITLADKNIEWVKKASLKLNEWSSKNGEVSFKAIDAFETMTDIYTSGYRIYTRTAYQEAVNIFGDLGLEPDEYVLDDCLRDVILTNPMPKSTHKECLQLLSNACRCILFQDEEGKINIKANFANVIEPDNIEVESNNNAKWSNSRNVLFGDNYVYADLTRNFMRVDGSQLFLPEIEQNYEPTGYVTQEVSNYEGLFSENPIITLKFPSKFTYYGAYISFLGNAPKNMKIKTYSGDVLLNEYEYFDLKDKNLLNDEFVNFDKISFEITKTYPMNRVLIDSISFGDLSDYTITKDMMLSNPIGYSETKTKDLYVKIYTYENDSKGGPKEVEDDVYVMNSINPTGETRFVKNPLISTEEHARSIGKWIGAYYYNNKSYEIDYRGEPALDSADIVFMENDIINNLQVEVEKHKLRFDGALSGTLELRRAMRMQEEYL